MGWKDPIRKVSYNAERYQRIKNDPAFKAKKKRWYLAKAEEISKANKEKRAAFRALHPKVLLTKEEKRTKRRAWEIENKELLNEQGKRWRKENREWSKKYQRAYYHANLSIKQRFYRLRSVAKQRAYAVELSIEEFEQIVKAPCTYCGDNGQRRGIDRVDNSKGYIRENCVACCKLCNYIKRTMTVQDFLAHIKKIHDYQGKN